MNKLTTYHIVFIREPIYRDMNNRDIAYRGYITGLGMVLQRFAVVDIVLESPTPPLIACHLLLRIYLNRRRIINTIYTSQYPFTTLKAFSFLRIFIRISKYSIIITAYE